MKFLSAPAVLTFIILVVLASVVYSTTALTQTKPPVRLVHSASQKSSIRSSKHWFGHFCFPFSQFHCEPDQNPSTPTQPPPFMQPPFLPAPSTPLSTPPPSPSAVPKAQPPQPPPPPPSNPNNFADQRLANVYPVIQKLKSIITSDPMRITDTWVGFDICNYKGFFCDNPPDNATAISVASIDFNGYQLTAPTLDGFLDQFPDIALFHANSNNFGGSISPNVAKLRYLYEIDISNNKFSGPFPPSVLGMDTLTFLDLRFNQFSGIVPPAIFTQNLEVLFLNDNSFMSTLPENLGKTNISYLTLADNKFTGPLPSDISAVLSSLSEVVLQNNQLTGCLPYEIGLLKQATVFDVSYNQLTGPLPFSLACLENIELLNFAGNQLYGMLPDMICQLSNLANLTLTNNYLEHVGPICRNLINSGVLDVTNNCIFGLPFQRSIAECSEFHAVPRFCPFIEPFKYIPCKPSHFPFP